MGECVRCGFCCLNTPCSVRAELHGENSKGRCPELVDANGTYLCDAAARFAGRLRIGKGCHFYINPKRFEIVRNLTVNASKQVP